ncbi:MAG: translesion DNA synthesis-associated protein ImuA [Candidatus Thiodiazotropha lotti]|nr:translesion DNA synthesis-associated protein ImuA [Candidatus Thiodiazotropha lotti]
MKESLKKLLNNNQLIWCGERCAPPGQGVSTGHAALDAILPEAGWLRGALIEVISPQWGIGEIELFLPAMAAATQANKQLAWIAPPYIPYPPALVSGGISLRHLLLLRPPQHQEIPWAMETVLRQRRCAMVLAWPGRLLAKTVRRLQLAAEAGGGVGVLFRSEHQDSSFAATRLLLTPGTSGLQVTILKSRASRGCQTVDLALN